MSWLPSFADPVSLANEEAEVLRACLEQRIDPTGPIWPVSLLAYQPIVGPEHPQGRLVDIGPRPVGSPRGLVFQPVGAGHTGTLFARADASEIFQPVSQAIDEEALETYRQMPIKARRKQVALEKLRYGVSVPFHSDELPPANATIHQLPLAPSVVDLTLLDLPILGLVYTITPAGARTRALTHLIHTAQHVSQVVLVERARFLWGEELLEAAREAVDSGTDRRRRVPFEELVRLCAVFLLSQHWFFPHRGIGNHPSVAGLANTSNSPYALYGWCPPAISQATSTTVSSGAVEELLMDLTHLCRQLCAFVREPKPKEQLRAAMMMALSSLGGKPQYLYSTRGRAPSPTAACGVGPGDVKYITLGLPEDLARVPIDLPVFALSSLNQSIRSLKTDRPKWREAFFASLCPRAVGCPVGRLGYVWPDWWMRIDQTGTPKIEAFDQSQDKNANRWLVTFVRVALEGQLQATNAENVTMELQDSHIPEVMASKKEPMP